MSVDAGLEATEVRVAVTGAIYSNANATPVLPTTASSALAAPWVGHGYASDAGVTETTSTTTQDIRAWQNNAKVRTVTTEGDATYNFTLIQTNAANVGLYYGDTVNTTSGSVRVRPGRSRGERAFVIDVIDGTNIIRTVIPRGEITEVGDQVYVNGQAVGYPVTIEAYAGEDGVAATKYYSELAVPPPLWTSSTAYTLGARVTLSGGAVLEVTVAGTSGATQPTPPAVGSTVVDGTVTWVRLS